MEAATLQQSAPPEVIQPEIEPYAAHNAHADARKVAAGADEAEHRAELARLNVVGKRRELMQPPESDDESAEPAMPTASGLPPQGESLPA